jgi:hypothetical protein
MLGFGKPVRCESYLVEGKRGSCYKSKSREEETKQVFDADPLLANGAQIRPADDGNNRGKRWWAVSFGLDAGVKSFAPGRKPEAAGAGRIAPMPPWVPRHGGRAVAAHGGAEKNPSQPRSRPASRPARRRNLGHNAGCLGANDPGVLLCHLFAQDISKQNVAAVCLECVISSFSRQAACWERCLGGKLMEASTNDGAPRALSPMGPAGFNCDGSYAERFRSWRGSAGHRIEIKREMDDVCCMGC